MVRWPSFILSKIRGLNIFSPQDVAGTQVASPIRTTRFYKCLLASLIVVIIVVAAATTLAWYLVGELISVIYGLVHTRAHLSNVFLDQSTRSGCWSLVSSSSTQRTSPSSTGTSPLICHLTTALSSRRRPRGSRRWWAGTPPWHQDVVLYFYRQDSIFNLSTSRLLS